MPAQAASNVALSFSPNKSDQLVGSTFDVSLVLNTGGQAVNALEVYVSFPSDKLQVVSPSVGNSFVSFWVNGPSFSNTDGSLVFQGGLPNPGINTAAGIISTITFRAKSAGTAFIKYQTSSKVLANDGSGTSLPITFGQAAITVKPSPPAGPVVVSSSHEDPGTWYATPTFEATWTSADATDYSYVFDQVPTTTPDETAESQATAVTHSVTGDGQWFFHIRAKAGDVWGATTHFVFKVDGTQPAQFGITTDSSSLLSGQRGVFGYQTTDGGSGIDHYEVRILRLDGKGDQVTAFTEAVSPYQTPKLDDGKYKLIVRAIDRAGNVREATLDFSVGVVAGAFPSRPFITNPILINVIVVSLIFLLLLVLLLLLAKHHEKRQEERALAQVRILQQEIARRRQDLQRLEGIYYQATQPVAEQVVPPSSPPASNEAVINRVP